MSSTTHGTTPYYFVPDASRHPFMAALGLFFVILGAGQWINGAQWGMYSLMFGMAWWLVVLYQWFRDATKDDDAETSVKVDPEHLSRATLAGIRKIQTLFPEARMDGRGRSAAVPTAAVNETAAAISGTGVCVPRDRQAQPSSASSASTISNPMACGSPGNVVNSTRGPAASGCAGTLAMAPRSTPVIHSV